MLIPEVRKLRALERRVPPSPVVDPLITAGYSAVRKVMLAAGVNPSPRSRVAFADDPRRFSSGTLGGTVGNSAQVTRVAFVQVWAVANKYWMQLHIYNNRHASTKPLQLIADLAGKKLHVNERCELKDAVACGLSKKRFAEFLRDLKQLAKR